MRSDGALWDGELLNGVMANVFDEMMEESTPSMLLSDEDSSRWRRHGVTTDGEMVCLLPF